MKKTISERKQQYCKKCDQKDIPVSVGLASYQDVSYVRHGLDQLANLKTMFYQAKSELMDQGMQNIEFAIAEKAFAEQETSLHNMQVAHREMSKIMRENGYRKVMPELDWVDDEGEPLGFTNR